MIMILPQLPDDCDDNDPLNYPGQYRKNLMVKTMTVTVIVDEGFSDNDMDTFDSSVDCL